LCLSLTSFHWFDDVAVVTRKFALRIVDLAKIIPLFSEDEPDGPEIWT
jgi:hypothetical protein